MFGKAAKKQVELIRDYQRVFLSPSGKAVLHDLMTEHHVMSPIFRGDRDEAIYRDGERNVVLRILTNLNMNVADLERLIEEAKDDVDSE